MKFGIRKAVGPHDRRKIIAVNSSSLYSTQILVIKRQLVFPLITNGLQLFPTGQHSITFQRLIGRLCAEISRDI